MSTDTPSCRECGQPLPAALPAARVCTSCALTTWRLAETPFETNTYCGAGPDGALRYVKGRPEVLFTAPSAVNFWRGQSRQKAARYTGSAVLSLAAATGMSALAAMGQPRELPFVDSPEYAFADGLRAHVTPQTMVIDLLGMRDRSFDVCLGLGPMPSRRAEAAASAIEAGFKARGIRVSINIPFAGLAPWTVTSFTQLQLGASAVQVQVAAWLRDPVEHPMEAKLTLDVLRNAAALA